jgi:hypothetical protein
MIRKWNSPAALLRNLAAVRGERFLKIILAPFGDLWECGRVTVIGHK